MMTMERTVHMPAWRCCRFFLYFEIIGKCSRFIELRISNNITATHRLNFVVNSVTLKNDIPRIYAHYSCNNYNHFSYKER